ncbi:MAG TPA: RimK family alpha-L-glutamate ligase [Flavobacteriales bacterium]|nr:RimK family alpha-L-glutamate ligase [Flavobacteriales bacterium]
MNKIIVCNDPEKLHFNIEHVKVISTKDYLNKAEFINMKQVRLFNLCDNYTYQSKGYYISLLAEARGHRPIPSVKNILDFSARALAKLVHEENFDLIQKSLKDIKSKEFTLSIYFGQNLAGKYKELSQAFHRFFQVPYFRVKFVKNDKWKVHSARIISTIEIPESHLVYVRKFASDYFDKKRYDSSVLKPNKYSMAILVKDGDEAPPSNKKALEKFIAVADKLKIDAEIISPKDFNRLPAFDALFIRMNTHVRNESYRFSRKSQSLGIALVDYPDSILKCSNKVFMTEAMIAANIPTPKCYIFQKDSKDLALESIGLPCVLKLPDSSFSFGVKKAETKEKFYEICQSMLKVSDLLICQEYVYTDFDWRIGILDGEPIYACKYFMARGHWQIYNWSAKKRDTEGNFATIPIEEVPSKVVQLAVRSAKLVGDGLYGIDIKDLESGPTVIEVNDNPNIDYGVEDKLLGTALYEKVLNAFIKRIESS